MDENGALLVCLTVLIYHEFAWKQSLAVKKTLCTVSAGGRITSHCAVLIGEI